MNSRSTLWPLCCALVLACGGGQSPAIDVTTGDTPPSDLAGDQAPEDLAVPDQGRDLPQDSPGDPGTDVPVPDIVDPGPGGDLPPDVPQQRCDKDDDCEAAVVPICHALRCDLDTHLCVMAVLDGTPCDPLSACEVQGTCRQGECRGEPRNCDDRNDCTEDSCDPATGCIHDPAEGPCDDGNACTEDDRCVDGACQGTPTITCACRQDEECAAFEDGDFCNGTLRCIDSLCQVAPETVVQCDPSEDTFCRANTCIPETGLCAMAPVHDGEACNDGDACTVGDLCQDGNCQPGEPAVCEDRNPCTVDSCDPVLGCVFQAVPGSCDDGNACTDDDQCVSGLCLGTQVTCDDDNPCTQDYCDPARGCQVRDVEGPCNDGDVCTIGDFCSGGTCQPGLEALQCDDGNLCTADTCDPVDGCLYRVRDGEACDDVNACTVEDRCAGLLCIGDPAPDCDDGNLCTIDSCDPGTGCVFVIREGMACDDLDRCTQNERCTAEGLCAGSPIRCDDGNSCTRNDCDPATGCTFVSLGEGSPCDDGNACTLGDTCGAEDRCMPGPARVCPADDNPCTAEVCAASTGDCVSVPLPGTCDDGNPCTIGDLCVDGRCTGGNQSLSCDDGNLCTLDTCDPEAGCLNLPLLDGTLCDDESACTVNDRCLGGICTGEGITCPPSPIPCTRYVCQNPEVGCQLEVVPDGTPCDDGNFCTLEEQCQMGICKAVLTTSCDDGNPCTTDVCRPETGECVHGFNTLPCEDGNLCTQNDVCDGAGRCIPGTQVTCDDGNLCTADLCDPALGCIFRPIDGLPCGDGDQCTVGDRCLDGACTPTGNLFCDDGRVCTSDRCDPARGCIFEPLPSGTPCDDGNRCTTRDYCDANGTCLPGPALNCDDGNVCTTDSCDPRTGCLHVNNTLRCDDGNACTENDQCGGGTCQGKPVNCWNNNPCLLPGCDPAVGCVYSAATGVPCDDGNACTVKDQCTASGTCAGAPINPDDGNPCTSEVCDPVRGIIRNNLSGGSCRVPSFPYTGTCSNGVCTSLCVTSCNADGSPCTYDWCAGWSCHHDVAAGPACSDGDGCTTADVCQSSGQCLGTTVICDDRNPCTKDSCSATGAQSGCQYVRLENAAPCPEGHCWFGVCLPL